MLISKLDAFGPIFLQSLTNDWFSRFLKTALPDHHFNESVNETNRERCEIGIILRTFDRLDYHTIWQVAVGFSLVDSRWRLSQCGR